MKHLQKLSVMPEVVSALYAIFSLVLFGTIMYRLLEKWTWVNSFYFSVSTLSTVGYGDLLPSTDMSKLFTAFYILAGVTVSFAALGIIGNKYLEIKSAVIYQNRK